MANGFVRRVIPQNTRRALLVGAIIGFLANIILAIPSSSETDSGFVFLILLPILTINGAILWFLLSKLVYGGSKKKWLYVLLLILVVFSFIGPNPLILLLSLILQAQAHLAN